MKASQEQQTSANVVAPRFRRSRSATEGRDARAAKGTIAAIAQEAHDVALLVTVTGSIVNAIVACKRPQLRTSMATYLPATPSLFHAAIAGNAVGDTLPLTTLQALISFYDVVAFARSATLNYSAKREPGGITGPISMETLGEAWQAAATQGIGVLALLGYLDPNSPMFEDGRDTSGPLRLVEMMWGVMLGRSPCVRIDGAVVVPGWIERRTHLRREINAPATLVSKGVEQRIIVRDLSAGGIGVEGSVGIEPGDSVRVSLGGGMRFDGIAVWHRDGRVGVRLAAPPTAPISPISVD